MPRLAIETFDPRRSSGIKLVNVAFSDRLHQEYSPSDGATAKNTSLLTRQSAQYCTTLPSSSWPRSDPDSPPPARVDTAARALYPPTSDSDPESCPRARPRVYGPSRRWVSWSRRRCRGRDGYANCSGTSRRCCLSRGRSSDHRIRAR